MGRGAEHGPLGEVQGAGHLHEVGAAEGSGLEA